MSILETLAIFAGIPAAVILAVVGLAYAAGAKRARRYRPGRPFEFTPVWFVAAPEQVRAEQRARPSDDENLAVTGASQLALNRGETRGGARTGAGAATGTATGTAVAAAAEKAGDHMTAEVTAHDATGGASDRW